MALAASAGCRPISSGPCRRGPEQREAVDDRGSGARIGVATDRHRDAEYVARSDKPHNDLLAVRRDLGDTQTPMQQQEERMRILILGEDDGTPLA